MLGIITAMQEELDEILNFAENIEQKNIHGLTFYKGIISNKECLITVSGVGKVNAARTTQIMIDNYNPTKIINVGVAGSCSKKLNIGDIVIGKKIYQHDFDITIFNHNLGYVPSVGDYVECTENLAEFQKMISETSNNKVYIGSIASGDKFISDKKEKEELNDKFNALCCEMEGASIAQVCYLSKIPFLIIRSISDTMNDDIKEEYEQFLKTSSQNCARFIEEYFKRGDNNE